MTDDIKKAISILKSGGLVAFPTETVYGLGADATNPKAIEKIFQAKGRPATNPLIVHVADIATAKKYSTAWPESAQILAEKFWPGPLTLILPKSPDIAPTVTAGRNTLGLRVPNHPLTLELLKAFGGPLAAPSANRSTRVSPTTASHVRDELGPLVDLVLDGGPCTVGIESTILDLTADPPIILRPGAISVEQFESLIGRVRIFTGHVDPSIAASSPGQQRVHYSPSAAAYRFEADQLDKVREWRVEHFDSSFILTIGEEDGCCAMPSDPIQYAQELYAVFHRFDRLGTQALFVQMPPDEPQWLAVRDRLLRATRPLPPQFP